MSKTKDIEQADLLSRIFAEKVNKCLIKGIRKSQVSGNYESLVYMAGARVRSQGLSNYISELFFDLSDVNRSLSATTGTIFPKHIDDEF